MQVKASQLNLFSDRLPKSIIQVSPNLAEVGLVYKTKMKSSERPKITCSSASADELRKVWDDNIEHVESFVILLLNQANKVLGWAKISVGGVAGTVCDPKVIFQFAICANASGIILAHNHPSGNLTPSQADFNSTKKLVEAGKLLDIAVLDHIILTEDSYYSFADEGRI